MSTQFFSKIEFPSLDSKLNIKDSFFFIGSCFSDNISQKLKQRKYHVLSNPFGILFDTPSILQSLVEIEEEKVYDEGDLFLHNELWTSWSHHSEFSDTDSQITIHKINESILNSKKYIRQSKVAVLTLGSAFSYFHRSSNRFVANCHKIPQVQFEKRLLTIDHITQNIEASIAILKRINPEIQIILTISPVRHLRDGVIQNNRSKSRLIEAVHGIIEADSSIYYFPSYELVIDVLRDYRFFDIDFAHPNYQATEFVFDSFATHCLDSIDFKWSEKFLKLHHAMLHRPMHPDTQAHQQFLQNQLQLIKSYQLEFPFLDFQNEKSSFESQLNQ